MICKLSSFDKSVFLSYRMESLLTPKVLKYVEQNLVFTLTCQKLMCVFRDPL